ncbi:MAG: uroporphyrinogen-III C-methyltransferase [Limisphaerales bacterium]
MSKPKPGHVYLVGAGPGDPGLLTLRGAELLRRAEVVVHDALINPVLLRLTRPGTEIIDAGKRRREHTLTQDEIHQILRDRALAGKSIVRLKGGDPYVFGRGGEEAEKLAEAGVPFEVVPGVSSFSAVPSTAGIPLTHRDHASAFTVLTGHEDPTRLQASIDWRQVAGTHGTKVILMGLGQLAESTRSLIEGGMAPSTPAALIRWGTTGSQQTIEGTLSDIAQRAETAGLTPPVVAVIGDVVRLRSRLNWFEQRSLFGSRIVVTRSREQVGELARALTELGADVLEVPTIRIQPPEARQPLVEALAGIGEYDWIVFTSPNGVTAFFDALTAAFEDIRALGNARVAAVGPTTAARIREYRVRVDAVPDRFVGKAVAQAIAKVESLENLRILLARAETANRDLYDELEQHGSIVDDVGFYRTVPETDDLGGVAERLITEGADWITFTSGSTVENFHARFDLPALLARHPGIRLASIGPETSKAIRSLNLEPSIESSPHTTDGLVQALRRAVRKAASAEA